MDTNRIKILVIGNGMVGHQFVESMSASNKACEITVLSAEPRLAYDRVHLSEFFDGKSADDLALTTGEHYDELGVNFVTNEKVTNINRSDKSVTASSGKKYSYDKLILATGSYPFVPPIPGNNQEHCLVYRTIEDLKAISASAKLAKVGVVIGGGLLGLEAANAIKQLGLETHVVEFAPQLMAVQLDQSGGNLLKRKIEELGVTVHIQKATQDIVKGDKCRYKLQFSDGTHLETDLFYFQRVLGRRMN